MQKEIVHTLLHHILSQGDLWAVFSEHSI